MAQVLKQAVRLRIESAFLPSPAPAVHPEILELIFDNTRRALTQILRTARGREHARPLIAAFWSYQWGLDGLMAFLRQDTHDPHQ